MPVITYQDVADYLQTTTADDWPAVMLIFGEASLCKKASRALLERLAPTAGDALGVERFDGAEDGLDRVLTSLNTYALLARTKVVVLHDARLFYSPKTRQGLHDKMIQAAKSGEMKKASRPFLNLMALHGLDFEDLGSPSQRRKLAEDEDDGQPAAWLTELVDYCRDHGLRIPEPRDDAELLRKALQRGFPENHRLVVTADFVDRRKALYKKIVEIGLVVDCSVPRGESRSDRMAQEAVMQAAVAEALARAAKRMEETARRRLLAWTGFDLPTLGTNLEKLISFVGQREAITDADVTTVLQRTRKDPIFDFTNAVAERDLSASLFLMRSLLDDGMHPLQLVAALANQLRRLVAARDFIDGDRGRSWNGRLAFPHFKSAALKAVQSADEALGERIDAWDASIDPSADVRGSRKTSASSDLMLVKNPKSPFPVYQTLKKADSFSIEALRSALIDLSETDRRMKSTGQDPHLLLEAFLMRLCATSAGRPATRR